MSSYFFSYINVDDSNAQFIDALSLYSESNKKLIYVLSGPLTDKKYSYSYKNALILLSPGNKIVFINVGDRLDEFQLYVEDVIEDIGSIADKYDYRGIIGRPRQWSGEVIDEIGEFVSSSAEIEQLFSDTEVREARLIKKIDLLISLFIGSINDIDRVKEDVPVTLLDKVKQKIQLFDGDQTRFIYKELDKKRILIQGLSGTGKTELLLHKLKELYTLDNSPSIYFTCHNKILAYSLRDRIPAFFDFMKVEQQIEWGKRLWCNNAWGGAYKHICSFYQIPFVPYSRSTTFGGVCKLALSAIKDKYEEEVPPVFTYMFIDESQDFEDSFLELCELVTEKNIYVAGDIFQSIFDENFLESIEPDYLLGKCYRTDPKTLMFAHAMGMGLFEKSKLRWLEEKEWKDCGYQVDIEDEKLLLRREPSRRFEDLQDDFESIRLTQVNASDLVNKVIEVIKEIRAENESVEPGDVGIILLDSGNKVYNLMDRLALDIRHQIGWEVNKAHETKKQYTDEIFLSNRNNVKGLEFPFVICVTDKILDGYIYRNALYTMLSRSFLKTFLIIGNEKQLSVDISKGLKGIIADQQMVIEEPTSEEKEKIMTRFKTTLKRRSHYEVMNQIFEELNIDKALHNKLFQHARNFEMIESDYDELRSFVNDALKYML